MLRKLLCSEQDLLNKNKWLNQEGQPYPIFKVFGLAGKYVWFQLIVSINISFILLCEFLSLTIDLY